jgi:hypothetical protein
MDRAGARSVPSTTMDECGRVFFVAIAKVYELNANKSGFSLQRRGNNNQLQEFLQHPFYNLSVQL